MSARMNGSRQVTGNQKKATEQPTCNPSAARRSADAQMRMPLQGRIDVYQSPDIIGAYEALDLLTT